MILDGKKIATSIYDELKIKVQGLDGKPKMAVVLVGKNKASLKYIEQKRKWAQYIGIDFELFGFEESISEVNLLQEIKKLNNDRNISGYIIQLPLPAHISKEKLLSSIHPNKDIDGFHPENQGKLLIGEKNGFTACTPAGIMRLLQENNVSLKASNVTVIGRSNIVGKPLTMLLINAGATVSSCNSHTKNLREYTKNADIIISAAGQVGLIGIQDVKKNHSVVIDVGFNYVGNTIYGDCKFDEIHAAGNLITPVPGGVGPLTVAMLMENTLKAYLLNSGIGNF